MSDADFSALEERLGQAFSDHLLLERALSHRSWCAEHPGEESNERLEFLGDAILGMVVTDLVFRDYPHLPEGELAKVRATVVSAQTLAQLASELDLGAHLFLGRGEEQSGGRHKASILADAMEAVIGALYLDAGWDPAQRVVTALLSSRVEDAAKGPGGRDFKTRLQELSVQVLDEAPRYDVHDDGPDHAKQFHATVYLHGEPHGVGHGSSKKQAEQEAAAQAWDWLQQDIADRASVEQESADA